MDVEIDEDDGGGGVVVVVVDDEDDGGDGCTQTRSPLPHKSVPQPDSVRNS